MSDAAIIRGVLIDSIGRCSKSRAAIADEMSYLVGRKITERMLNGFTAESRDDYRWPAELDRAFCAATGDDTLLKCRAEMAGYVVITAEEAKLLELGRQYLIRKRADQQAALLEKGLEGMDL